MKKKKTIYVTMCHMGVFVSAFKVVVAQVRLEEVVVDYREMDYQTLQETWLVDNNAWMIIQEMLMVVSCGSPKHV